jgi:two-component system, NarL family, response regulator NreC
MSIRILIADDHKVIREGLRALIATRDDMEVVGEAADGRQAVELAGSLQPDVVIMDVGMPELNGIEAARQIARSCPNTHLVALSINADQRFVSEMLQAGAGAYLIKTCDFEELVKAIQCVLNGRKYLSPDITSAVVDDYLRRIPNGGQSPTRALSPKEREVLQLLAEGNSVKDVAAKLHVSVKTVHTHRQHLMGKLGLSSLADLTKYAIREGLTTL